MNNETSSIYKMKDLLEKFELPQQICVCLQIIQMLFHVLCSDTIKIERHTHFKQIRILGGDDLVAGRCIQESGYR